MTISLQTQRGFTIVELLVALSVGTIIVLMVSLVFVQGVRHTQVVTAETRIVKASTTLVESLTYHIRNAGTVDIEEAAPPKITLMSATGDDVVIELENGELQIQGRSILDSTVDVTDLSFTSIDNTVLVEYELDTRLLEQPFVGQLVITPRN